MTEVRSPEPVLVIHIHLHDDRFHGRPDWPPAPSRVFQALVAAAGKGCGIAGGTAALRWLEGLAPPIVGAPHARSGRATEFWVPHNDADSVGGIPERVSEIRTAKLVHPWLLDPAVPFFYAWTFPDREEETEHATTICSIAKYVYQFGRGVDMAWAVGRVLDRPQFDEALAAYPGEIYRPVPGVDARPLACPTRGSLDRLNTRFKAMGQRFIADRKSLLFSQPPMVHFAQVAYGGRANLRVFELRAKGEQHSLARWPLTRPHELVTTIRDRALAALHAAFPEQPTLVDGVLLGRRPGADSPVPTAQRVRILPLPSIGHEHADLRIRRVAIELPHGGPFTTRDLEWAFSDVSLDRLGIVLVADPERTMLDHYGCQADRSAKIWRTVTPVALPGQRQRSGKDLPSEPPTAATRQTNETRARQAVVAALRHAGVIQKPTRIEVRKLPFDRNGVHAQRFAPDTRFDAASLWHTEIEFAAALTGPLAIGSGRFVGLGIMRPVLNTTNAGDPWCLAWAVDNARGDVDPNAIAVPFRRAVMSVAQTEFGEDPLPELITGHADDGSPARDRPRVHFQYDPRRQRLLLTCSAPATRSTAQFLKRLEDAMSTFRVLRAGSAGTLQLTATGVDHRCDPLFRPSTHWRTITPYLVNRHTKCGSAKRAIEQDLLHSCRRHGLPEPKHIEIDRIASVDRGLSCQATLTFSHAIRGPISLGRSRFKGGGLFEATATIQ